MAWVHIQESLEIWISWVIISQELEKWKIPILFYKSGLFIVANLLLVWKLTPSFILCLLSSDFLVPDYLNQEQEETLVQYDLGEHSFESNSSVQMPVISQVSSTQNCESTFPLGSLGGLAEKEEEMPEQPKTSACTEATRDDPPKSELSSITIE